MVPLTELVSYTNNLLEAERFRDYCPNGLQVEGKDQIKTVVSGVTASYALLDKAAALGAEMVLVHHGYFWKGEDPRIVGMKYRRLRCLLDNQMSLLASHLPLDAHPLLGNNAQLADKLKLSVEGRFGNEEPAIGMYGRLAKPMSAQAFLTQVADALQRQPLHIPAEVETIHSIAWCSGAAQSYIEQAAALGVDAFLTGEASEQTVHTARECGLHFFSAGHHATERFGVQALGEHLSQQFDIQHHFIDIENPV